MDEDRTVRTSRAQEDAPQSERFSVTPPAIGLPKGGGAIRGIGEKFAANPVTGTGGLTVPIFTSPGRGGFGPKLALSYDSGAGNGPFGFGWTLGLPAITRKTDRGLPRYRDADESDVFIMSGAEDLVPALDGAGDIIEQLREGYRVRRYRPRIEGLFARIERWSRPGDVHWRTIARDNTTTVYGRTDESRVVDPADSTRIFSWLVCESYDGKGNAIAFSYAREDGVGIDLTQAHERNRGDARGTARYLSGIRYGNVEPQVSPADPAPTTWMFEVVVDYDADHVEPISHSSLRASLKAGSAWRVRPDPFSSYRSGFEVRTYRRCRRVLMFHRIPELGAEPELVRSTDFEHDDLDYRGSPGVETELAHPGSSRTGSFLRRIAQRGYLVDATRQPVVRGAARYLTYTTRSLPPVELAYSRATIRDAVRELDPASLENLPAGIDGARTQWVDLDGEGLSGALTEQGGAWFYKRNVAAIGASAAVPHLAPVERIPLLPTPAALSGGQQLVDVSGDGRLDVVRFGGGAPGYFERTADGGWESFRPFDAIPNAAFDDPALRFVDLTGDGLADLLIGRGGAFTWYPSLGARGFAAAESVPQPADEELGPRVVFADASQSIHLADMSGDGLNDIVRVRNGEVCYWPSLGYGRFGPKVTMDRSPWFDRPDRFDHRRVRLADIDGSGTTDVIYLGADRVALYFNQSGNGFTAARTLTPVPRYDDLSSVTTADLLGNGTACLVWSSSLAREQGRAVRYVDLMGGNKPNLLVEVDNNLGARTRITYAPSTKFFLADRRAGTPWITRLPYPVHCVEKVTVTDSWRGTSFSTSYSYHHGFHDGVERELRGFGRVEQVDVETFGTFAAANIASPYVTADRTLYQPPVKTITWYHTGAALERERVLACFDGEYFRPDVAGGFREHRLPEPQLPELETTDEWREAVRACKGGVLRQEVYELDVDALDARGEHRPVRLFQTAFHNCEIRRVQARGPNRHAVFLVTESEAIQYHYDLDLRTANRSPDPRIAHTLNLDVDRFGNVRQTIAVGYPRVGTESGQGLPAGTATRIRRVQSEPHVKYTENRFSNAVDDASGYRTPEPCEVMTHELTGVTPAGEYFALSELRALELSDLYQPRVTPAVPVGSRGYHELPGPGREKRLVEHRRILYFDAALAGPRPLGTIDARGLKFEDYKLALTDSLLAAVFGAKLTAALRAELGTPARSGYLSGAPLVARFGAASAGQYWARSGVAEVDAARFYLPTAYVDAFGNRTSVTYFRNLLVESTTDAVQNTVSVRAFDLRVLAPARMEDANGNLSELVYDPLGLPAAMAMTAAGDSTAGIDVAPPLQRQVDFFAGAYVEAEAAALLGSATARHLYSLGERIEADGTVTWGHHPASAAGLMRERHLGDAPAGSRVQAKFEYSDGGGTVLVAKSKAEPAPQTTALRWIASGKTVLNNKGKPVKQYEPYFSANQHRFEEPAEVGVTPILYYDAIGRLVRSEAPDGSFSRVEHSPWHVASYDGNDTVGETGNAWYAAHTAASATAEMRRAAAAAIVHADTPAVTYLDSLCRSVVVVAHERHRYPGEPAPSAGEKHVTFTRLDAEGKPLWIRDARENLVMQYIQPPMADDAAVDAAGGFTPCYDIAGNLLFQHSMDSGDRWTLNDAVGKPLFSWDANERAGVREDRFVEARYDGMHRPTEVWLRSNGGAAELIESFAYGEGATSDRALNLRGRVHVHHDPSGRTTVVRYDFAGQQLEVARKLAADYRAARLDWQTATLEPETYRQITIYDALGRIRRLYSWHTSATGRVAVYEPVYNERGLLEREDLVVRARKKPGGHDEGPVSRRKTVIDGIRYDAKGQREAIHHANGTQTRFVYDPKTFRLVQLRTTRPGYDPAFPSAVAQYRNANVVQNLFYTYDPVGNLTEIVDDAFRPAFFANQIIEPESRYTYDSLYRLIAATGREHRAAALPVQREPSPSTAPFPVAQGGPADQRNYVQRFRYDPVGNIRQVAHTATTGWTRNFVYQDHSNRLASTSVGTDVTTYPHDTHGNMLALASVAPPDRLEWDHRDMIRVLERGGGGRVYYQYDADKQRTRKVSVTQNGAKAWERIYLAGMEIYRRYGASGAVVEETETHHLFEGDRRVLLVEDEIPTAPGDPTREPLYRYQYSNHLGSACLELDDAAAVISYEEYHPYGTTAYRMARSLTEAPRRYRFTGMERDEESGLSYHTARYYAPWLARWCSPDPAGLADGISPYPYCRANPATRTDPGGKQSDVARPKSADEKTPSWFEHLKLDYKAIPAAAAHGIIEGIVFDTWIGGTLPTDVQAPWLRGGFVNDRLAGNNLGLNEALADRRIGNVVEQVKSFWRSGANAAAELAQEVRDATRDAANYVRTLPRSERLTRLFPRARFVLPSWASRSLQQAGERALQAARAARDAARAIPAFRLAPIVTRGIAGTVGVLARGLQKVAAPLLVAGLAKSIYQGDRLGIADNTIGLVPMALQAVSRLPIPGPLAAFAGRATSVTAAFAVGWAIGRAVDEHVLSDETRNTIGGTVNEIVSDDGWKEIYRNPFGLKTLYQSLKN